MRKPRWKDGKFQCIMPACKYLYLENWLSFFCLIFILFSPVITEVQKLKGRIMPVSFSLIHNLGNFYRISFSEAALDFLKRKGWIRPFVNEYSVETGHRHCSTLPVLIFVTEISFRKGKDPLCVFSPSLTWIQLSAFLHPWQEPCVHNLSWSHQTVPFISAAYWDISLRQTLRASHHWLRWGLD